MESPRKKLVLADEAADASESSESVVLQCSESGALDHGDEVAMAREGASALPCSDRFGRSPGCCDTREDMVKVESGHGCVETAEDGVSESQKVVGFRCVDRGVRGRKASIGTPRVTSVPRTVGYWRTGARRRYRARQSLVYGPFGDGAAFVFDRAAVKRKHEEVEQCSPLILEVEHHEDNESDDSASSSDSDASDSQSEQWKRGDASSKRRRGGEDVSGKSPWSDASLQLRSGGRKNLSLMARESVDMQEDAADYDDELQEMQELLELQLQAAEKREAGMKQRMETMMDVLFQYMGHMEKRVGHIEEVTQPQEQVLERINVKLEKVMEGFSALNENLAILSACLSNNLESQ